MNTSSAETELLVEELAPHILQIRLNRPERMNALGVDMTGALRAALARVPDSGARVLVMRGTGKAFCAGADLKERRTMQQADRVAHNAAIYDAIAAIEATPIPVIAAINGLALGGGCEMVLACDLRIIVEDASIGLTESRIGAIPGAGGTQRLPRVVGAPYALEMMLTGEPISGLRAAQIGLANRAVPAAELESTVREMATRMANLPSKFLQLKKSSINRQMDIQGFATAIRTGAEIDALLHFTDTTDLVRGSIREKGLRGTIEAFNAGELL